MIEFGGAASKDTKIYLSDNVRRRMGGSLTVVWSFSSMGPLEVQSVQLEKWF